MVILRFMKTWRFWAPLLLLLGLEWLFRTGYWEDRVTLQSHAGRSVVTKRALASIDGSQVDYVTLGDSRARQGIHHKQMAALARAFGKQHINLALPGSHFLSLKVLSRLALDQLPQLQGMVLVIPPGFLQSMGNGEYELGIVRPLRTYTDSWEMMNHVPVQAGHIPSWGSFSDFAGYREDLLHWVNQRNDSERHEVNALNIGRWWLEWTAEYPLQLCGIDWHSDDVCDSVAALSSADEAVANVQRYCRQSRGTMAVFKRGYDQWRAEKLPVLKQAWQVFLTDLGQRVDLVVVTLPQHSLFEQRSLMNDAVSEADTFLADLQQQGHIHWLDLRTALSAAEIAECAAFRDPWHLNQQGQQIVSEQLEAYLRQHWYSSDELAQTP
jgi:hypothetical protein